MSRHVVACDLGQQADPSAIAVLEVVTRQDAVAQQFTDPPGELAGLVTLDWFRMRSDGGVIHPEQCVRADVRHLERLPLKLDYTLQVEHVAALLRRPPLVGASLVIDATGVGRAVLNMFRRRLWVTGVTISAGDRETRDPDSYHDLRVAKSLLVSHMQAALHGGTLRIAKALPDARALTEEMADFTWAPFGTEQSRWSTALSSIEKRHSGMVRPSKSNLPRVEEHPNSRTREQANPRTCH